MIATLLVVIILGILVTIVLTSNSGTPTTTGTSSTPTTTQPKTVAAGASEATLAACEANFVTLETAVESYEAVHGSDPPSGTTWATSAQGGQALLPSWPTSASYVITWSGSTLSVVPHRGVASRGSFGSSSPASGCYAG